MSDKWIPEIGDRFVPSSDSFGHVHTVSNRSRDKKQKGRVFVYDEQGDRRPLEQCHLYDPERPLSDVTLKTMVDTCEAVVEAGDAELLAMLECLAPEQKKQVWGALTTEVQEALKALRKSPAPAQQQNDEGLRVIIAGSRTITDYALVEKAVQDSGFKIKTVLSGKEPNGVDRLGEIWAEKHGVPVEEYHADWNRYGKSAGPRRNKEMGRRADALVLVWDGRSAGSKNMLMVAIELDLQIHQVNLSQMEVTA